MYSNEETILKQTEILSANGYAIFPVHGVNDAGYCRCGNINCRDVGKHPDTANGLKDAVCDVSGIKSLFKNKPKNNIGIATGKRSNIIVVDVDDVKKFSEVEKNHEPIKTLSVKTSKGRHLYFKYRKEYEDVKNCQRLFGCVDIRCDGGYVVGPGSRHKSGHVYEFDETYPIADLPGWIEGELPRRGDVETKPTTVKVAPLNDGYTIKDETVARIANYCKNVPPAIQGQGGRNDTFKLFCYLIETFTEATDDQIVSGIDIWNHSCQPPWNVTGLRTKLNEARLHVDRQRDDDDSIDPDNVTDHDDDMASKPIADPIMFDGILGDAVKIVSPYTEADPVAILVSLITLVGSYFDKPTVYGGQPHHANLFACLVGASARARKGTSLYVAKQLLSGVIERPQTLSGIGSGEGLIDAIKDVEAKANDDGSYSVVDGSDDKRVIVEATEFGTILKVIKRDGCTLSPVIRDAWDGKTLRITTKGSKLVATDPHVTIIAHVTTKELNNFFNAKGDESSNGFANRFLWVYSERSKRLPLAPPLETIDGFESMTERLAVAIARGASIGNVTMTKDAERIYKSNYDHLTRSRKGLYESVTTRSEAQVIRLALILAVVDGSDEIDTRHITQSLSIWSYCDDSARYVFGDDDDESRLAIDVLSRIKNKPGQTKSSYRPNGKVSANDLTTAIEYLIMTNQIHEIEGRYFPGSCQVAGGKSGKPTDDDDPCHFATLPLATEVQPASKVSATVDTPATLAELFDYRNNHPELRFVKNNDGVMILESKDPIPEPIRLAVAQNQDVVSEFVKSHEIVETDDDFTNELAESKPAVKVEGQAGRHIVVTMDGGIVVSGDGGNPNDLHVMGSERWDKEIEKALTLDY